jgi:microcystin-dependent protein
VAQNPISNLQASLALTQYFPLQGVFPSQGGGGGGAGFYLGEIGTFAGAFAPAGTTASGQFAVVAQNQPLFSVLGTNFGGNGTTTFELPNLDGITMVGTGEASGLGSETIGQKSGSSSVLLNYPQAPPNILGQSQPFDNHQPSLGITYEIETEGVFPSMGGGPPVPLNTLGMIKAFAGTFAPAGYMACNGQLLSIAQNRRCSRCWGRPTAATGRPPSRFRTCAAATSSAPVLRPRSERRSGRQM